MVILTIISLCCGLFSLCFIIYELNLVWDNIEKVRKINKGWRKLTLLWKIPIACQPVATDILLTMAIVALFSMAGQMGMLISLLASGMISLFLLVKRGSKNLKEKI